MEDAQATVTALSGREVIESEIERLVAVLDEMDGDFDLEESADNEPDSDGEPQLGAPEARTGSWAGLPPESFTDDAELDEADDEPELGAPENNFRGSELRYTLCAPPSNVVLLTYHSEASQTAWAKGTGDREELDHDGEPGTDDEPEFVATPNWLAGEDLGLIKQALIEQGDPLNKFARFRSQPDKVCMLR